MKNPQQGQHRCECGQTFKSEGELRSHEQHCAQAQQSRGGPSSRAPQTRSAGGRSGSE